MFGGGRTRTTTRVRARRYKGVPISSIKCEFSFWAAFTWPSSLPRIRRELFIVTTINNTTTCRLSAPAAVRTRPLPIARVHEYGGERTVQVYLVMFEQPRRFRSARRNPYLGRINAISAFRLIPTFGRSEYFRLPVMNSRVSRTSHRGGLLYRPVGAVINKSGFTKSIVANKGTGSVQIINTCGMCEKSFLLPEVQTRVENEQKSLAT